MPRPGFRSRTFRRVWITTPGGTNKISYRKPKPGKAHCSKCKKILPGVARGNKVQVKKLPRTQRRPDRPYGGKLCSKCTREEIKKKVRL